jgi:hypothetical protein
MCASWCLESCHNLDFQAVEDGVYWSLAWQPGRLATPILTIKGAFCWHHQEFNMKAQKTLAFWLAEVAVLWQGYGMAMLGNTLLLSYFLDRSERSAALVQVVGITSNFAMLSQVWYDLPFVQSLK